ncbi:MULTISPECIES: LysR family transcriptional regulator [Methylobacterium]|uniref:LysR family transcriptional regulator n=4 Tax=Methylobacteriaceae TaxID=119045 RepID=A0A0C6EXG1_9HYPH|nr:LysR family transcriptional regulator [Methylobacterium aquaticum]BAQ44786.1 LysR family transcriptional regulator [Methylobacterium aquaticum]
MSEPVTRGLGRLTMRQMLLLATIDDSASLKGAATRIGMSQPRATKSLQEIEDMVEQQLFTRTNRGLTPTIAGACAIRHAKVMLSQIGSLEEELRHIAEGAWAKLRIGTIMGATPIVTEAIGTFSERFPNVSLEILEDTSVELLRLLDRGDLDLMIGRSSVSGRPELYDTVAFHDELLTVVANPAHPLVERKRVTLAELSQSRWIVYTAMMPMRISLEQEYREAGLAFPRTLVETRSAFATMSLLHSSPNYIALLSSDVAAFFVDLGAARTLNFRLRSKSQAYEVITRRKTPLPPAAAEFIRALTMR